MMNIKKFLIILIVLIGSPLLLFSQNELVHQWSQGFVGENSDKVIDIVRSSKGYLYITGTFKDTIDMDPGIGTNQLIAS
ncbi:MAG: hypothetical protein ABEH43_00670, partial [Flavobacteriales bacterium]